MIPKTIHYCWFGKTQKSDLIKRCVESWKKHCPDYEVIEWNENNFDVETHHFTAFAQAEKKWAFVSDYVRFKVLYEQGGIYLDTDMFLLKGLDELLENKFFSAYENDLFLSCGAIGAEKENFLIKKCLDRYDTHKNILVPVPKILTSCYNSLSTDEREKITIYHTEFFYPFNQYQIKNFNGNNAPEISYGVHLWNYSWGNPMFRTLHKLKGYYYLKVILEKLGIKSFIKRIFKMP